MLLELLLQSAQIAKHCAICGNRFTYHPKSASLILQTVARSAGSVWQSLTLAIFSVRSHQMGNCQH